MAFSLSYDENLHQQMSLINHVLRHAIHSMLSSESKRFLSKSYEPSEKFRSVNYSENGDGSNENKTITHLNIILSSFSVRDVFSHEFLTVFVG